MLGLFFCNIWYFVFFSFFHSHFVFTEKDTNNDILWTWSYPAVSEEQRSLFTRKSCLSASGDVFTPFLYSQHNKNWYYILTSSVQEMDNLPKVCIDPVKPFPFMNIHARLHPL